MGLLELDPSVDWHALADDVASVSIGPEAARLFFGPEWGTRIFKRCGELVSMVEAFLEAIVGTEEVSARAAQVLRGARAARIEETA